MEHIDKSLEDIIAIHKRTEKEINARRAKTALKTTKAGRVVKAGAHHLPLKPRRQEALFTETYKALAAPIKEIFTSRYIPQTGPIKLIAINTKAIEARKAAAAVANPSKPIRLVASRTIQGDSYRSGNAVYRSGDYYRPSYRSRPIEGRNTSRLASDTHSGKGINSIRKAINKSSVARASRSIDREIKMEPLEATRPGEIREPSPVVKMDTDSSPISIKGVVPTGGELSFRGEGGPATIEIENLDPGTTAEDVKVVCSRFGEIRSCICLNGFSQVTYARKAAAVAALETLNGKKADNDQILRVTMRKAPIIHNAALSVATPHVPSPLSGPMQMLTKAVEGTIKNAGTLYQEQLQAAQQVLKVQQHRMAQLQMEEQRIEALRLQNSV
ncbi:hypothetical protein EDD21DRAFT_380690 [Dissophora ornata]|nr:hypothetical protein BGZ58_007446 [Dissophora ornata]KAI8599109.1 hypothetical protein EDD21DRAFT_380690 [Dissophora ornata]